MSSAHEGWRRAAGFSGMRTTTFDRRDAVKTRHPRRSPSAEVFQSAAELVVLASPQRVGGDGSSMYVRGAPVENGPYVASATALMLPIVSPDFRRTLGNEIVSGCAFTHEDTVDACPVVILSESPADTRYRELTTVRPTALPAAQPVRGRAVVSRHSRGRRSGQPRSHDS
jgi:hypothetical protein